MYMHENQKTATSHIICSLLYSSQLYQVFRVQEVSLNRAAAFQPSPSTQTYGSWAEISLLEDGIQLVLGFLFSGQRGRMFSAIVIKSSTTFDEKLTDMHQSFYNPDLEKHEVPKISQSSYSSGDVKVQLLH